MAEPLPFRLPVPGSDSVGLEGVKTTSYKVYGLLHVTEDGIALEWSGTRNTEHIMFIAVETNVDDVPLDWREVPATELISVRIKRGWLRPVLELRARYMDTFEGVPSARGVTLRLRVARRDRALANEVVAELEHMIADTRLARENPTLLEEGDSNW